MDQEDSPAAQMQGCCVKVYEIVSLAPVSRPAYRFLTRPARLRGRTVPWPRGHPHRAGMTVRELSLPAWEKGLATDGHGAHGKRAKLILYVYACIRGWNGSCRIRPRGLPTLNLLPRRKLIFRAVRCELIARNRCKPKRTHRRALKSCECAVLFRYCGGVGLSEGYSRDTRKTL